MSDCYLCSGGTGCYGIQGKTELEMKAQLMIDAWHLVIQNEMLASDVHREFMKIRAYRDMLSSDLVPKEFRDEQGRGPGDL